MCAPRTTCPHHPDRFPLSLLGPIIALSSRADNSSAPVRSPAPSRKLKPGQNRNTRRKEVLSRYQGDWSSVSHLRGAVRLFASKMGTSPTMIVMLLLPDLIIAGIRNVLEIGCEPGPDAGKPAVCVMILAQISHFFADNHAHMIAFQ